MATFLDPRDPPFPKPAKRRVRSEGHQGVIRRGMEMWIVGTAIACCTATCRDPPGAAIFCKAVDSLGCARRPHQGNLFTILLGTWSAPASTPRFVVARRTNCRFTAPYSSRAPRKRGKVWRCGLKDVGGELGAEAQENTQLVFHVNQVPFFSAVWKLAAWDCLWHPWEGVQLVLARPQGFPS